MFFVFDFWKLGLITHNDRGLPQCWIFISVCRVQKPGQWFYAEVKNKSSI